MSVKSLLYYSTPSLRLPSSGSVPSLMPETLCEANKRVVSLCEETCSVPKKSTTAYTSYSAEDHTCIGKYSPEHGLTKAISLPSDLVIYNRDDQLGLIKQAQRALNIDPKRYAPGKLLSAISGGCWTHSAHGRMPGSGNGMLGLAHAKRPACESGQARLQVRRTWGTGRARDAPRLRSPSGRARGTSTHSLNDQSRNSLPVFSRSST